MAPLFATNKLCSLLLRNKCISSPKTSCLQWLRVNTCFRHSSSKTKSQETPVVKHLRRCIQTTGPLTVADYMREVLTNPITGYYMSKDVFGTQGDFVTSPEISQMFGELIALWIIHEWTQSPGKSSPLQVVELGPGRGTLADDMLRVFKQFQHITGDLLSLHLVEVSPKMSQLQEEKLTGRPGSRDASSKVEDSTEEKAYKSVQSKTGVPVSWYRRLQDVPKGTSCFVAHEFFDALPIHKFQRTNKGWREVMVDVDDDETSPHHLRFVLSPAPTPASIIYPQETEKRDQVEISPDGGSIIEEIAERILQDGGMSLIVDYGHDGTKTDTLRGFRKHHLHDVLCEPGTADLTADVDFSYFRHIVKSKVSTHGPITQEVFLKAMGIETRLKMLLKSATPEQSRDMISGYKMLTDPAQMGNRFKFFSMMPLNRQTQHNGLPQNPAGFPS
ncbi:protein arginine methyltransferase NDUFAF7, mitochondrial-like isoform X1 [Asterias amurensis]|uniref:protein arginine methyltransferase NDUFAF7, mitochondrial-like isoform X1 n=2 Tax=Asterias amurensis TaxID=7602 RepID=UPI003AB7ECE9